MLQRLSSVPVGAFMRLACIELSCGAAMAGAPSRVAKGDAVRRGSGLLGLCGKCVKLRCSCASKPCVRVLRWVQSPVLLRLGAESGCRRVWILLPHMRLYRKVDNMLTSTCACASYACTNQHQLGRQHDDPAMQAFRDATGTVIRM